MAAHRTYLHRFLRPALAALLLTVLLALALPSGRVRAHSFLLSSDPPASSVLATPPREVRLTFAEPVEASYTEALLYSASGQPVADSAWRIDSTDPRVVVVSLPFMLPNGTYSVVWRTLSAADGHKASGYVPMTFGTAADVRSVVPPPIAEPDRAPAWLGLLGRWLALLGLAVAVAIYPIWLLVLRPAIAPAWQAGPALARRARETGLTGVTIAGIGSLISLVDQAWGATGDGLLASIRMTLGETRYGEMWVLRAALLLALGLLLNLAPWWWPRRHPFRAGLTLIVGLALPIAYSLVAHAAARLTGRAAAIASDYVHLTAAALWAGGLAVLLIGLLPTMRDLTPEGRRTVLSRTLPRFSAIALAAWGTMSITGFYNGWLQVGSLDALRTTDYGRSLTAKLLLLLPALALAALNLLVISRGLQRTSGDPDRWRRRFSLSLATEVVVVALVLLVAGRMIAQTPARDAAAIAANQHAIDLDLQGREAVLTFAPGRAGPNHYRLDIAGDELPPETEALLRLTAPGIGADPLELTMERTAPRIWEWHGVELAFAGDWTIDVVVRQEGVFQYQTQIAYTVEPARIGVTDDAPQPWIFGWGGIAGLALVVAGLGLLTLAWRATTRHLRREQFGLATLALAGGIVLLITGRLEGPKAIALTTPNPIAASSDSIEKGREAYLANCVQCHGVNARGDGPLASTLVPPPANFVTVHSRSHLDAEYFNWIKNGKPPSAMPAFAGRLTDEEIWHVVNYLRSVQASSPVESDIPVTVPMATPEASPEATPAGS